MRAASLAVLQPSAGRAHPSAWETIGGHRQLAVNHRDDRASQTSIPNLTPDTDFAAPSELNWEVCTYRKWEGRLNPNPVGRQECGKCLAVGRSSRSWFPSSSGFASPLWV